MAVAGIVRVAAAAMMVGSGRWRRVLLRVGHHGMMSTRTAIGLRRVNRQGRSGRSRRRLSGRGFRSRFGGGCCRGHLLNQHLRLANFLQQNKGHLFVPEFGLQLLDQLRFLQEFFGGELLQ